MPLLKYDFRCLLIFICLMFGHSVNTFAQRKLSRADANEKVVELKSILIETKGLLKKEERNRRREADRFQGQLDQKQSVIEDLLKQLYLPAPPSSSTSPLPPPPPSTVPTTPPATTASIQKYLDKIARLEGEIAQLRKRNSALSDRISVLDDEVDGLKKQVDSLTVVVSDLENLYNRLVELYDEQVTVLACIKSAAVDKKSKIDAAQPELIAARKNYTAFLSSINDDDGGIGSTEEDELLTSIYETYQSYGDEEVIKQCGDIPFPYAVTYMTADDHLVMARILANHPRHLLDYFGKSIDQRVAKSNAELLRHTSSILELGDYDQRALAMRLLSNLPELLVVGASTDVDDSTGVKTLGAYKKIPRYFANKEYAKVISEYSRFRRFEGEKSMKKDPLAIAKARYCAGMVLLFDLGNVSRSSGLVMPGTFLAREGLNSQQATGTKILNEVVNMVPDNGKPFPEEIVECQTNAAYGLSKSYGHSSKKPIKK